MKSQQLNTPPDIETLQKRVQRLNSRYQTLFGRIDLEEDVSWPRIIDRLKADLLRHGLRDYDSIDAIMRHICHTNRCNVHDLHDQFVSQERCTPDEWISARLGV